MKNTRAGIMAVAPRRGLRVGLAPRITRLRLAGWDSRLHAPVVSLLPSTQSESDDRSDPSHCGLGDHHPLHVVIPTDVMPPPAAPAPRLRGRGCRYKFVLCP